MIGLACALTALALWCGVGAKPRMRLRRGRVRNDDRVVLLAMVDGLVAAITAGAAPSGAVDVTCRLAARRLAAGPCRQELELVAARARDGEDLAEVWTHAGRALPEGGARRVVQAIARGWLLSAQLGCPLAPSLSVCAGMLRADLERDRRVHAAVAGPRATMQLLTALPIVGLALAGLAGMAPWQVLLSPVALLTLVPGLALIGLGRFVSARLIVAAQQPAAVS